MSPPTLLLVPGAWFPGEVFNPLVEALKAQHPYDIVIAPYPSINPQGDPNITCETDTIHVRENFLKPLVESGRDVVVFTHSYGGMVGAGAATGFGKRSRSSAGHAGGVIGLIMASGFAVGGGISCAGAMGGSVPPWILKDKASLVLYFITHNG